MKVNGRAIGKPASRVDGRLKVTGEARYAAEEFLPGMSHGVLAGSPIAHGRIVRIDTGAALKFPGVLAIYTHENRGLLGKPPNNLMEGLVAESRLPLADDEIHYAGQYVAMVIAETFEQARDAAARVKVHYRSEDHAMTIEDATQSYEPKQFMAEELQLARGNVEEALAKAAVSIDATYDTPCEHPNAIEPHASIAYWQDGTLTVRNATQFAHGDRAVLAGLFDLPPEKVRILAPFLGGMFGSKAATGGHTILAALAARELQRPVKVILTREQVMTTVGYRSRTIQRFELGAKESGELTAMRHTTISQTSARDEFVEPCNITSRLLYKVPNYQGRHELRRVHTMLPSWMRGPGETPCQFAQESAMDELAVALHLDPIELRRRNDAEQNGHTGKPFSSKHLIECYDRGAEQFGWYGRNPEPASTREGRLLLGMGMATATYPGYLMGASVSAKLERVADGVRLSVRTAASDVGTGLYTVAAITAAEVLALPFERIDVELGDSNLPFGAVAGGSNLTASVTPAVYQACAAIRSQLCVLAVSKGGPLAGGGGDCLDYAEGHVFLKDNPVRGISYAELLDLANREALDGQGHTEPVFGQNDRLAFQSFGAIFAEVTVDSTLHLVRLRRMTGVFDAGRIINPKTARSQMLGGMIFGAGMALLEEMVPDQAAGRFINADLGDYLVPVNADIPDIDVSFINEPDLEFNPIGCRGLGELGNPGTAAAIANAVYHATGKRIRSLPILPEKLMSASSAGGAQREEKN
jgi:xanthine dehydrogenase YagR molybdenum-binding subunit